MTSNKFIAILVIFVTLLLHGNNINMVEAQLTTNFYSNVCPLLPTIVRSQVLLAVTREARMAAYIIRLLYQDCLNGCDGSILLDDTSSFKGEQNANANRNYTRVFDVIDNIKSAVEAICPRVVSCADILTIAARDSVVNLGGPSWSVKLGRKDAKIVNQYTAIPKQLESVLTNTGIITQNLIAYYAKKIRDPAQLHVNSTSSFMTDLVAAIEEISNISVLTGSSGEIRKVCGETN